MRYAATLDITWNTGGSCFISWKPPRRGHGANKRDFPDATALRRFLRELGIQDRRVDEAVESRSQGGTHSIPNVQLTAEQIAEHGLGPI